MRCARVAMLLGLAMIVSGGARAQKACEACEAGQPAENTVAAWLQSGDPRLEAWGAAFALKRGDQALVPEMVGLARSWNALPSQMRTANFTPEPWTAQQEDDRVAMGAVLDALVEMRAAVDTDAVRRVAQDFPSQAIVLAARMSPGEVQPLLMEWFELPVGGSEGYVNAPLRRAAAAMLANHPAPGFVAELMRGTHVRMTIAVVSPDGGSGKMSSVGDCMGMGTPVPRADWPAVHTQVVRETTGKEDRAKVLVAGVDPIRVAAGTTIACGASLYLDDRRRGRLIAQMLGIAPKDLAWGQRESTQIVYESDSQIQREIRGAVDLIEGAMKETEKTFESRGLITSAESGYALPQLEVWVWDQRSDHPAALPLPSMAYSNFHWSDGKDSWSFILKWD